MVGAFLRRRESVPVHVRYQNNLAGEPPQPRRVLPPDTLPELDRRAAMDSLSPKYVFPVEGVAYSDGTLAAAGVFLLEGRCHVAPLHSTAAYGLVAKGALRIATLCFDPDPLERSHPDHPVTRLDATRTARHFHRLTRGN